MELRVPGDKSMTQRALILAALAEGESRVSGLLTGADPRATAGALRALGAGIPRLPGDGSEIRIDGVGLQGLRSPSEPLDLGNSGTGARLLLGVLAGAGVAADITGDASLRARPMGRVTEPLQAMGARFEWLGEEGRLPVRVLSRELGPLEYETPVASAQVKSALLLAGLTSGSFVLLTEPGRSRDHTERMLALVGAPVITHPRRGGWRVELRDPPGAIRPLRFRVPGDVSSAAFFVGLGLLGGAGAELVLKEVGLNPTRTGFLPVIEEMGGRVRVRGGDPREGDRDGRGDDVGEGTGEPRGDVVVRASALEGVEMGGREVVTYIDEIPLLAVLASRARGETRITDAGELRVKETDRIRALADGLGALGVEVEELEDGLVVRGTRRPLEGRVECRDDHRIAMAFGVLGATPGAAIEVDDPDVVEVSYPGFWDDLARVAREGRGPVITIDGPAGSGKSTTARAVAGRLGLRHLDSGALYRALTWALLRSGPPPGEWERLDVDALADVDVEIEPDDAGFLVLLEGRPLDEELRTDEVTEHVSRAASLPAVRARLLELQRRAGRFGGLVADGRDMGSVVFPDADLKVFLVADLEERARRRVRQRAGAEPDAREVSREMAKIRRRDRLDSEREHSPLTRPEDARVIDTTDLAFEAQVDRIVGLARPLTGR